MAKGVRIQILGLVGDGEGEGEYQPLLDTDSLWLHGIAWYNQMERCGPECLADCAEHKWYEVFPGKDMAYDMRRDPIVRVMPVELAADFLGFGYGEAEAPEAEAPEADAELREGCVRWLLRMPVTLRLLAALFYALSFAAVLAGGPLVRSQVLCWLAAAFIFTVVPGATRAEFSRFFSERRRAFYEARSAMLKK